MIHRTDDIRIKWTKVVLPPIFLEEEMPLTERASSTVNQARKEVSDILHGKDHDANAALEYGTFLKTAIDELSSDLCLVMRVYFEKPRTTVGWKGMINDPNLDQSFKINEGLRLARHLLLNLAEVGVPAGTEFLDMIIPQYLASLVSWGAIGARTTESQIHRELVSGLSCPVGFKNGTSGDMQIAIEAVRSAACPHNFLGHTKHGQSAIFATLGNPDCHVILRGGRTTVNYDSASVALAYELLEKAGLPARVMIDCSHANSKKDYTQQPFVCREVIEQIANGDRHIIGVMLESNLVAGAQKVENGKPLVYGKSITDACIGWDETLKLLRELAAAVRSSRTQGHGLESRRQVG
jgi:3-deoxy-7-phosphoheptulonate synthase